MNSKDLENKSSDELTIMREGKADYSPIAILVKEELERRARIQQHELDRKLIMEQIKAIRFTAYVGITASILGAIVGALLTYFITTKLPNQNSRSKNKTCSKPDKTTEHSEQRTKNVETKIIVPK